MLSLLCLSFSRVPYLFDVKILFTVKIKALNLWNKTLYLLFAFGDDFIAYIPINKDRYSSNNLLILSE